MDNINWRIATTHTNAGAHNQELQTVQDMKTAIDQISRELWHPWRPSWRNDYQEPEKAKYWRAVAPEVIWQR